MKIYCGIDGGGTRTRLALVDENGGVLGFASGGSCSFTDHGLEPARAELTRLWHVAWRLAGTEPRPADAVFMGLGSILAPADAQTNCELAAQIGLAVAGQIYADNDAWNAHAGGLGGRPGILLIAGTGSASLGRNAQGESWRVGGWGHLLGETGSAYALGLAAMIAATRASDGRGPATALTELVIGAFRMKNIQEIFCQVHGGNATRANVAALAPRIVALAVDGDAVARQILVQGADGLAEMVATVATRLHLTAPEIAPTGGLIMHAAEFRRQFLDVLGQKLPGYRLVADGLAPVWGAVLLAMEHATGAAPSASFLDRLKINQARFSE
jgi:glucosamine kinase